MLRPGERGKCVLTARLIAAVMYANAGARRSEEPSRCGTYSLATSGDQHAFAAEVFCYHFTNVAAETILFPPRGRIVRVLPESPPMLRTLLLFPWIFLPLLVIGQSNPLSEAALVEFRQQEKELAELAYTMHTDSSDERRFLACRELITSLVATLTTPDSYQFQFDSLPGVIVRASPDGTFRMLTWELHVSADEYRHYGAVQRNTTALTLTPLIDRGDRSRAGPETSILEADNWLGYVVYDIIPAGRLNDQPVYFLFGFDRFAKYQRRKILDVVSFDPLTDQPRFGAPIFKSYNENGLYMPDRTRFLLQYGAEVNAALEYDPRGKRVIFENLVMIEGNNGEGPVMVPDGSYHALELTEDGIWEETDRVYDHKYENAPRDSTRAETKTDLFGRRQ